MVADTYTDAKLVSSEILAGRVPEILFWSRFLRQQARAKFSSEKRAVRSTVGRDRVTHSVVSEVSLAISADMVPEIRSALYRLLLTHSAVALT